MGINKGFTCWQVGLIIRLLVADLVPQLAIALHAILERLRPLGHDCGGGLAAGHRQAAARRRSASASVQDLEADLQDCRGGLLLVE